MSVRGVPSSSTSSVDDITRAIGSGVDSGDCDDD
jgi:hypothetical protein